MRRTTRIHYITPTAHHCHADSLPRTGHQNNIVQPEADTWPSSTSHFSPFNCLTCRFGSLIKGITPKNNNNNKQKTTTNQKTKQNNNNNNKQQQQQHKTRDYPTKQQLQQQQNNNNNNKPKNKTTTTNKQTNNNNNTKQQHKQTNKQTNKKQKQNKQQQQQEAKKQKTLMLCFVLINSVLYNLLCVWILLNNLDNVCTKYEHLEEGGGGVSGSMYLLLYHSVATTKASKHRYGCYKIITTMSVQYVSLEGGWWVLVVCTCYYNYHSVATTKASKHRYGCYKIITTMSVQYVYLEGRWWVVVVCTCYYNYHSIATKKGQRTSLQLFDSLCDCIFQSSPVVIWGL